MSAHSHRRRGFTAVEISMVVTVIAILALLILPLFQRQTDDARISATESDIRTLAQVSQLANAHTNRWFALSSLDNTDNYDIASVDPTLDIPIVTWNDALTEAERSTMADQWAGPYMSFRRSMTPADLELLQPGVWFRGGASGGTTSLGINDGPINQQHDPAFAVNFTNDRIPIDPWGAPYIFYGPDYYHLPNGVGDETRWRNVLIRSLGPNGLPGDATTISPSLLRRENFDINNPGDDIFRIM